jgi:DNA-binding transcriptional regulator YbjK
VLGRSRRRTDAGRDPLIVEGSIFRDPIGAVPHNARAAYAAVPVSSSRWYRQTFSTEIVDRHLSEARP